MHSVSDRPAILTQKAKKLRKETGDAAYYSPLEARKQSLGERMRNILVSPFQMLVEEPMLAAVTVRCLTVRYIDLNTNSSHSSGIHERESQAIRDCFHVVFMTRQFVYGCIYLLFESYPIGKKFMTHVAPSASSSCAPQFSPKIITSTRACQA